MLDARPSMPVSRGELGNMFVQKVIATDSVFTSLCVNAGDDH